jgi:surface antigen
MNIWICNTSLGYMQGVSQQKQPKSLIEFDSRNSMLNEAERLTNEYEVNGSSIPWVATGNKYIGAIVAAPFIVTSDDEGDDDHGVGKSNSAEATANVSPARSSVSGSPTKRQRTEVVSPHSHSGRKGKRGTRVYEQIFYGRVVKYAPPSSDTENDELFHILWDDGDSQDYDAEELKAGVTLYESLHGPAIPSKDDEAVAAASASNEEGEEKEEKEEKEVKENNREEEQCAAEGKE